MGENKRKQYSRKQFLADNPWCTYRGDAATTTAHNPPRCFFERRQWPETYEFPACGRCNGEARLDEQVMAVLIRIDLAHDDREPARSEWARLVRGVRNNSPAIMDEWLAPTRNQQRRWFREAFGGPGDEMRRAGWGAITLGPLSRAAIDRFCVKLMKALYYRHTKHIFEGDIRVHHMNAVARDRPPEHFENILRLAPLTALPSRGKVPLDGRFIYRFSCSPAHGALYAVVQFSVQMTFQLIALHTDLAEKQAEMNAELGLELPSEGLFRIRLAHRLLPCSAGADDAAEAEP